MKTAVKSQCAGFTLIEVVIASAIFALVISAVFMIHASASDSYKYGMLDLSMRNTGNSALEKMATYMSRGYLLAVNQCEATRIRFQIPVDWDRDGDVVTDGFDLEWGAGNTLDEFYAFEFDNAGYPQLSENDDDFDYNGDGDRNDTLQTGRLVLSTYALDGVTQLSSTAISPPNIYLNPANPVLFTIVDKDGGITGDRWYVRIELPLYFRSNEREVVTRVSTVVKLLDKGF